MNTSPFIHSTPGLCCLQFGDNPQQTAIQQTNSTKDNGLDRRVNQAVRVRDQVVFLMLGVLGIGTSCILWKMNSEGLWLVPGASLLSVVGGLLFWGVLIQWLWTRERAADPTVAYQLNDFWFYSEGATHLGPVIAVMKELANEVQVRFVILLKSQSAGRHFKTGYRASRELGRTVAHALHLRVPRDAKRPSVIDVLDAAVSAFCTPMSTLCGGRDYVLVALFEEANLRFHGSIAPVAGRCVERIREMLEPVGKGSVSGHLCKRVTSGSQQKQLPVCCSVFDQVKLVNHDFEYWAHWSEWLHQGQGLPLKHTIGPTCAGSLHDVSLHPEPSGTDHCHAA